LQIVPDIEPRLTIAPRLIAIIRIFDGFRGDAALADARVVHQDSRWLPLFCKIGCDLFHALDVCDVTDPQVDFIALGPQGKRLRSVSLSALYDNDFRAGFGQSLRATKADGAAATGYYSALAVKTKSFLIGHVPAP
jgi:hypothetical protein